MTVEEFCRKKRVLTRFKKNCKDQGGAKAALEYALGSDIGSSFGGAFHWEKTPEGVVFWGRLYSEFLEEVEQF